MTNAVQAKKREFTAEELEQAILDAHALALAGHWYEEGIPPSLESRMRSLRGGMEGRFSFLMTLRAWTKLVKHVLIAKTQLSETVDIDSGGPLEPFVGVSGLSRAILEDFPTNTSLRGVPSSFHE